MKLVSGSTWVIGFTAQPLFQALVACWQPKFVAPIMRLWCLGGSSAFLPGAFMQSPGRLIRVRNTRLKKMLLRFIPSSKWTDQRTLIPMMKQMTVLIQWFFSIQILWPSIWYAMPWSWLLLGSVATGFTRGIWNDHWTVVLTPRLPLPTSL